MRILIVEDEAVMLRLLVKFFSKHGHYALQALDGEQAVDIYHRSGKDIDAVLLDLRLPKMGGDQVFNKIKIMNPAVKVVLASGYLDPDIKTSLQLAGVKAFVDKPYVLSAVLELIKEIVSSD